MMPRILLVRCCGVFREKDIVGMSTPNLSSLYALHGDFRLFDVSFPLTFVEKISKQSCMRLFDAETRVSTSFSEKSIFEFANKGCYFGKSTSALFFSDKGKSTSAHMTRCLHYEKMHLKC